MSKKQALMAAVTVLGGALGVVASTGVAQAQQWRDGDTRFHVSGRLQYDLAYTDADCSDLTCTATNESGVRSYARRAFLGVDGRLTTQWRYNVKFDFNLSGTTSVRVDDAFLEYAGDHYSFIIGNNNAISPMEDRDSSLNIPFNERSFLITAAGVGKRPGVAFITNGGNWSWGAALESNDSLDTADTAANGTESYFVESRFTWAPIYSQTPAGTTLLHLGLYGRYRDNGDGNGNVLNGLFNYAGSGLSNKQSNNDTVGGADRDTFWDLEAAFQWNAFGAEAEYGQIDAHDSPLTAAQVGNANATGYYIDVFWSPTGESRNYNASDGSFGGISPANPFGAGGPGHIMLGARYEDLDLTDASFGANRNDTTAWTLGATWVPISHVKFQLNYSQTEIDYVVNTPGVRVDNNIDAVTLRTQFDW